MALLMCGAHHFRVDYEINPYMDTAVQPDPAAAVAEHDAIVAAHLAAGRKVEFLDPAPACPDMVYTANAAVVRDGRTVTMTTGAPVLAGALRDLGLDVVELATTQLRKGGGGVRCTALTLDNPRRSA